MPSRIACLAFLLFFPQTARPALRVTMPLSVIQAIPGSDVILPCHFSDTSGPIDFERLAVMWKMGSEVIAMYDNKFEANRPGANMTVENLKEGNATLLLPRVQDKDDGVYTCFVIHVPDSAQREVELRVEAPPNLTHGPTTLQLGKPGSVMCTASGFYPGNISVTWLQDGKIVKGPEQAIAHLSSEGLFNAQSTLEFTPKIVDDNTTISCQIHHKAIKKSLRKDFQLHVQAQPIIEVISVPQVEKFYFSKCIVSRFYPGTIHIQWLHNGKLQKTYRTQPEIMPDGTFSIESAIVPQEMGVKVTYTCRVQHESLDTPLENEILWLPKGEGDIIHHTPQSSQSPGKNWSPQSSWPTAFSPCPTDSSVLETSTLFPSWVLGMSGLILGLLLGTGATVLYCKNKAPGEKGKTLLKNGSEDDKKYHQNMLEVKTEDPHDTSSSKL